MSETRAVHLSQPQISSHFHDPIRFVARLAERFGQLTNATPNLPSRPSSTPRRMHWREATDRDSRFSS